MKTDRRPLIFFGDFCAGLLSSTQEYCDSLDRVQKNALRIIQKERYIRHANSLNKVLLETLFKRR